MSSSATEDASPSDAARRRYQPIALIVAALLAILLIVAGVLALLGQGSAGTPPQSSLVGVRLKPFVEPLPRVNGTGSTRAPWRDHHGVVLVFFADWCTVCHEELPRLARAVGDGRFAHDQVIGIDGDDTSMTTAKTFVSGNHVLFPTYFDTGLMVSDVLAPNYPTTVYINHSGRIVAVQLGILTPMELSAGLSVLGPG